jgi:hypothetical protein
LVNQDLSADIFALLLASNKYGIGSTIVVEIGNLHGIGNIKLPSRIESNG